MSSQDRQTGADVLKAALSPSAKALIMTFWGDMLLPFGGRIWLGSLLRAMAPLGLDERAVRTSVHRLISEGWLTATRIGRRSELSMPQPRLDELLAVQRRMYRRTPLEWDGAWRIVVMKPSTPALRESLRRELHWQGYATIAPNTFIHPRQPWEELAPRLEARGLLDEIAHAFAAQQAAGTASPVELWPLKGLSASWERLGRLARLAERAQAGNEEAFRLRLLVAHALRMAVLHDPALPMTFLPPDWPEVGARIAVASAYNTLSEAANHYLVPVVQLADDSCPQFRRGEINWRFRP